MSDVSKVRPDITEKLKDTITQIVTILLDLSLLAVWMGSEYFFEHTLFPKMPIESWVAKYSLILFRITFALSTFVATALFLYRDIRVMAMRTQAVIREEAKTLAAGGNDD